MWGTAECSQDSPACQSFAPCIQESLVKPKKKAVRRGVAYSAVSSHIIALSSARRQPPVAGIKVLGAT